MGGKIKIDVFIYIRRYDQENPAVNVLRIIASLANQITPKAFTWSSAVYCVLHYLYKYSI